MSEHAYALRLFLAQGTAGPKAFVRAPSPTSWSVDKACKAEGGGTGEDAQDRPEDRRVDAGRDRHPPEGPFRVRQRDVLRYEFAEHHVEEDDDGEAEHDVDGRDRAVGE